MAKYVRRACTVAVIWALAGATSVQAAPLTWDANGTTVNQTDGGGAWLGANLWWDGSANTNWTSGDSATFGNNGAGGAVTLASTTTVSSLTFNSFSGTYTLGSAGQAITLNAGITKNAGGTAATIGSPLILGGAQTWLNNSAGTLTLNGAVNNGGNLLTIDGTGATTFGTVAISGAGGLTKNGEGRLSLNGTTVSISGNLVINGGEVLEANMSIGSGNLTLNGGVLEDYWGGNLTRSLGAGAGKVQVPGGVSGFSGQGTTGLTVTFDNRTAYEVVWGSSNEAGNTNATGFFNPSVLVLQGPWANQGGNVNFRNKLDLNATTRTIAVNRDPGATAGKATISGVIRTSSGTAGLTKTGVGLLVLSVAPTYNGDTTVNQGTLQLNAANANNQSSTVTIASGAKLVLNFSGSDTVDKLFIGTTQKVAGEYGHTNSGATNGGLGVGALDSSFGAGAGKLVVTSDPPDAIPPTLAPGDIVDDKLGGPVTDGVLVTYTVTFSEDMDATTVSAADFGNAGTAILSIDPVTETSLGVFRVPVTATTTGTLQLAVNAGADLRDYAGNPLDTSAAIADDTIITVQSADAIPPTLAPGDIVDDRGGGPVTAGTLVTYTVTFSEDLDATTVSAADFGNAGDAPILIGLVTEPSPGVFSVPVMPTGASTLQLRVNAGAVLKDVAGNALETSSAIADDTTIAVSVPMLTWDANGTGANQTDGAGLWLSTNQWWNGTTNQSWAYAADATFGKGGAGGAVTLGSPTMVHALTLNAFSGTYTLGSAGQTIVLNAGIAKNAGGAAATIVSPVALGGAQTWQNNSAGLLTVGAAVANGGNLLTIAGTGATTLSSDITGMGGLTKNNTGHLDMRNGAKSFSGTFAVNGGTVLADGGNYGTGNLTLNGGVLEHYWGGDFTRTLGPGAGQVQLLGGASGFSQNGSGHSVILNNNAAFVVVWGSAYFNPTAFVLQAATAQSSALRNAALTFRNAIDLNGTDRTVRVDQIPTAGVDPNGAVMSGAIANSTGKAGLIKAGVGKLTVSGPNTYNGDTKVQAGTLKLAGSSTLADGAALWIAGGAKVELAAGVSETVMQLRLGGGAAKKGTWGSGASSATHTNDVYFAGSGILTVLESPLDDGTALIVK